MKKTLIVLAMAATAAVSGSAMAAWEVNGSGGTVEFGGSLNPVVKATPWEVLVGNTVTDLNSQVQIGESDVSITINKTIPILAIRVADESRVFTGKPGISPQINYSWIDVNSFNEGAAQASAVVLDKNGANIGRAEFKLSTVGYSNWSKGQAADKKLLAAPTAGTGFFGGLPKNIKSVVDLRSLINEGFPELANATADLGGGWVTGEAGETFSGETSSFSAMYGSVIASNSRMNLRLDAPTAGDDDIVWKVSLPVIVTYA